MNFFRKKKTEESDVINGYTFWGVRGNYQGIVDTLQASDFKNPDDDTYSEEEFVNDMNEENDDLLGLVAGMTVDVGKKERSDYDYIYVVDANNKIQFIFDGFASRYNWDIDAINYLYEPGEENFTETLNFLKERHMLIPDYKF